MSIGTEGQFTFAEVSSPTTQRGLQCAREVLVLCSATYAHKRTRISTINGYPIARLKARRASGQILVAKHTSKADIETGSTVPYVSLGIEERDGSAMSFNIERRVLPFMGLEDDVFTQHILDMFREQLH